MIHAAARRWLVPAALTALASPTASAQPAEAHPCVRARAVRGVTGGALGAWVGFVAAKIKVSDWSDAARGSAGRDTRNRYTIGGAVLGLVVGSLVRLNDECGSPGAALPTPVRPGVGMEEPITLEEIRKAGLTGVVYDAVFALRRPWLNLRGADGLSGEGDILKVYLDNVYLGGVEQLRTLGVEHVISVVHFSGPDATYRWGAGNVHGAIEVRTLVP